MTERPSFERIYICLAEMLAQRSTCGRLKVGTVITSTDHRRVLAVGYNGNAAGLPNKCDHEGGGLCGCLHSEDNAVVNCVEPRNTPKFVYITHSPCMMCAKRLINLGGVRKITFVQEYRDTTPIELLRGTGITVVKAERPLVRI